MIDKRKIYFVLSVVVAALLIFIFWVGFVVNDFKKIDAGQKIGENSVKQ
ncbi:hypothetical protein HY932_02375 [Candidatus Falkowbacteria bacterium]|nr:hypothetical protein [Candidatus Falkowbacteria bacterium]